MTTLAMAGDTMLGRGVADHLATRPAGTLFGDDLLEIVTGTDGMILNLECCISEHGEPWPGRVFHFRAPPAAVDALQLLGVRCVTLANNHALDFGRAALLDTLGHLHRAGIAVAGAGQDVDAARAPARLRIGEHAVAVVSFTDHPADYAATPRLPGIAYAEIRDRTPPWLGDIVQRSSASDRTVLVSPHWGPNMTQQPQHYIRRAAADLRAAGAALVAGHSAHVFHGVTDNVLFDLGDFVDDYATNRRLRNDLGLLWLLTLDAAGPTSVEAVPLHLGYCHTSLADRADAQWVRDRFRRACATFGTDVTHRDGRLVVNLTGADAPEPSGSRPSRC